MRSLASILPDPEARACVEALYEANPDGTAELMLAFPEAVFLWLNPQVELHAEVPAYGKAQPHIQGRLM